MGKKVFEIICGTYEEYLLGYLFNTKNGEITQSFAAHDHSGSIRSLAFSENYLASGSTDDRIIIYDLKTRKEHCMLTHHNSTINCIQFTDNHSHVISGSSDGVLAIVRVGNWQLEKIWEKAHKGAAILDIAVHSSGKLALTLGSDASLCTWNLIKGRQAFIINLNSKCKNPRSLEKIVWGPDGVRFVLHGGMWTEIWSIDTGGPLKQIEHSEKVVSCIWVDEETLLVGYENGQICTLEIESENKVVKDAHNTRVKSLSFYKKWIVSASSSGEIKIWDKDLKELCHQTSGCRITCLCVVPQIHIKEEKVDESEGVTDDIVVPSADEKKLRVGVVVIEEEEDKPKRNKYKKRARNNNTQEVMKKQDIDNDLEGDSTGEPKRKKKKKHKP